MNKFEALQLLGLTGQVNNEAIKKAYRQKAKEFHPDRNPAGAEIMKMINVAYDMVKDEVEVNVFANESMHRYPEEIAAALNAIAHLGLTIEVCGLWVWVSGDTKPHKEILKNTGYFWSCKKLMWYFRPPQAKARKSSSQEWSIDQIRETYGSQKYAFNQALLQ